MRTRERLIDVLASVNPDLTPYAYSYHEASRMLQGHTVNAPRSAIGMMENLARLDPSEHRRELAAEAAHYLTEPLDHHSV